MSKQLRNIYRDFNPSFLIGFIPGPKRLLVQAILHTDFNKSDKTSIIISDLDDASKRDYALYFRIIYKGEECDRFEIGDLVLAVPASQDWMDKKIALIHQDDVVGIWGEGVWEDAPVVVEEPVAPVAETPEPAESAPPNEVPAEPVVSEALKLALNL